MAENDIATRLFVSHQPEDGSEPQEHMGRKVAVQCKRQAQSVGVAAIQKVVAGAAMCHCTATMVVTNRLFTPAAHKLAGIRGVELVDRVRLERLAISCPDSTT
jgi:HJR/Mrr/RecB family endonuclease